MRHLDQIVFYIASYILMFIIAVSLQTIVDLPIYADVIILCAMVYIIIMHNQILSRHILGLNWKTSDNKFVALIGEIIKVIFCLIIIKMMIFDLYQFVVIIYIIDFITLVRCERSLYNLITFTKFEGV